MLLTRFPQGAVMLTSIGRTSAAAGWQEPRSNVTIDLRAITRLPAMAIFGMYGRVVLCFSPATYARIRAVAGADLLASNATLDLTKAVQWDPQAGSVAIPGSLIAAVGTSARSSPDSLATPGMLLTLTLRPEA